MKTNNQNNNQNQTNSKTTDNMIRTNDKSFLILKDYVIDLLHMIKENGVEELTNERYIQLLKYTAKAFPKVKYDFIELNKLKEWDYIRYPEYKCYQLRKDFKNICNKYGINPRKSLYNNKSWFHIKNILNQYNIDKRDLYKFEEWFYMNKKSYELFFKYRENKNLINQSYYLVHHLLEGKLGYIFQDNFSETYILIIKELSYLQKKKNLMIMDDFIHSVIHLFINKFYNRSLADGASIPLIHMEYNSDKAKYLLLNYGKENIKLLKSVLEMK